MNTFKSYLEEGRDAPLYHGTTDEGAKKMLEANKIEARTLHRKGSYINNSNVKNVMAISLTRSFKFAYRWVLHKYPSYYNLVIFELDQRKLAQRYKIAPFNYFGDHEYTGSKTRHQSDYFDGDFPINQYEENIIGDIKNLDQYITKVMIRNEYAETIEGAPSLLARHPKLWNIEKKRWVNK